MNKLVKRILRDRHSLLLATVVAYIVLVVLEGLIMDRESRVYTFDNPYLELNLNNVEEFERREQRFR